MCMTHDMEIQYRGVCIKRKNHVLPTMAKNRLPVMGTKTVRRNCENKIFFSMKTNFNYCQTVNSFEKR